jgi:streptogramin lyase
MCGACFSNRLVTAFIAIAFVWLLAAVGSGETAAQNFTEFSVLTAASQPFGITLGPDGALWFTELSETRSGGSPP